MMRVGVMASLLSLAACSGGCGEAAGKPARASRGQPQAAQTELPPIAQTPAEIVAMSRPQFAGALERPAALRRFFETLAHLEDKQADDDVRVVQFGDSHTAADIQTAVVRAALQGRFGDGGRGFVAIGKPFRSYLQEGVRCGMSSEWVAERGRWEKGHFSGDGMYGLAGVGLMTSRRGARAWADVSAKTDRAEVAYLEHPAGGSFDLLIDGVRVVRVATRGERITSAFRSFGVADASPHQVEVRAVGDGDVRVFGVTLSRAAHGVVVDALGINGARVTTCLSWNENHWTEQLRHRSPALVVLAYGTNESGDETTPQVYERQLVDALGRVARAVPSASCLLLGPPDRAIGGEGGYQTSPKLLEIIASQKRVAEAAGCAFYDQLEAMGGRGSIAAWAAEDPPRAQKDRVHLTKEGYAQLGSAFASDLLRAYTAWRRGAGLPVIARAAEPVVRPASLPETPDPSEP